MGKTEVLNSTPVSMPLCVLASITEPQIARLKVLADGFNADRVELRTDAFDPTSILFVLRNGSGEHILDGLIEPSGQAHT